jgi:hypothetical protein
MRQICGTCFDSLCPVEQNALWVLVRQPGRSKIKKINGLKIIQQNS